MPYIPSLQTLTASTPNILNAIRNDIGGLYKDTIPVAANTDESIRQIGDAIFSNPTMLNAFAPALVNRIIFTTITSKSYKNPWRFAKKGILTTGETVQEIYISMAKPYQYNPAGAETTVYKRYLPDINAAYHHMNFQKFYPVTISREQLQQAFISVSALTDLISKTVEQTTTAIEYDDFQMAKYMLARLILGGKLNVVGIPAVTKSNMSDIVTAIKTTSLNLTYMSKDYNMAGVYNQTAQDEQYIILTTGFESSMDVNVLASAFNMDKVEFMGHRVGVDGFGKIDSARLALLFDGDSTYTPLTSDELTALNAVPAVTLDKDFFMIFDNLVQMEENRNGKGLYINYFYHIWRTYSASPFAQAVLFSNATPAVTSVTMTPAEATMGKGTYMPFTVDVVTTGFASKDVTFSVTGGGEDTVITPNGVLTIGKTETATSVVVHAVSKFDNTKSDTSTVTIA